jgi:predicted alpha/beta superfamily hydrolase
MLLKTFKLLLILLISISFAQNNIKIIELEAEGLGYHKKIWIYTPKDYNPKKKYKVLYMHDGQNLFDAKTSYAGEWQVDETLDSIAAKTIVVGIEHGGNKRIEELTPYKNEKYGGGKADLYLEFLVKTVMPYVEKNYRVKKGKNHTSIGGSSLGGLISFYATLKYPELFGKAMVFSPAFWFNPEIFKLFENTKKYTAKVYFMCGDSEDENMEPDMRKMIHLLHEKRCSCKMLDKYEVIKGGKHNEKLWQQNFAKAYLWLF